MLNKPEIGAPCNGCGLCCRVKVCSTGSYALGLVNKFGERASGPCPAIERDGERVICGLVKLPTKYLPNNPYGVTKIRDAVKILIGASAGCDEAGDEMDATAAPKLRKMQSNYLDRHSETVIRKAVDIVLAKK